MSEHGEDRFVKAILVIRDGLTEVVKRLNDIVKEYAPPEVKAEKVEELFPDDLRAKLTFEAQPDATIIRPKQFLGSEVFSKIASIVKEHGGSYISEGKSSRFQIPKGK